MVVVRIALARQNVFSASMHTEGGMKRIGQADLLRGDWRGWKKPLREVLLWPPVNILAKHLSPRVPVAAPTAVFHGDGFDVTMLRPRDCQVAAELFRHGGRFTRRSDDLVLTCLQRLAQRSSAFVDIGAYSALFALVAAKANPACEVHAFEIVPETYLLAQANVIANDLVGRVNVHLHGLGGDTGQVHMPAALNTSSLPSSLSLGSAFEGGVRIPVDRLDDLLNLSGRVAMKLDVEGWEPQVLAGAADTLRRLKPDIIIEILRNDGPAVEAILAPLGYGFWHFTDDGLVRHDHMLGVRGQRDWLLTCDEDPRSLTA
jgi:FkbM family methyltransferase